MHVLITGANGFLGNYLVRKLMTADHVVIATGKGSCRLPGETGSSFIYEPMDFTIRRQVSSVFEKYKPEVIIHAGAMSKPDDCELDRENAYTTNVEGTSILLQEATKRNCFFSFISTDFIFDGAKGNYAEEDEPGPVNYYGQTKLLAENEVRKYDGDWNIIRTVLVYGRPHSGRQNLLTIVREKLEKGEPYFVFNDQWRTPTFAGDLADGITRALEKKAKGIFHISGKDFLSPFEMARRTADLLHLDSSLLSAITASDMQQPARRPPKTGFDISKAEALLGYQPLSFDEGLQQTFTDQK